MWGGLGLGRSRKRGGRYVCRWTFDPSLTIAEVKNRAETRLLLGHAWKLLQGEPRGLVHCRGDNNIRHIDGRQGENDYRRKKRRDCDEESKRVPGDELRYKCYTNPKGMYVHKAKKISLMSEIVDPVLSKVT